MCTLEIFTESGKGHNILLYITDCLIPLQRDWCDLIGLIECWLKCYWQQLQVLEHKAQDTL